MHFGPRALIACLCGVLIFGGCGEEPPQIRWTLDTQSFELIEDATRLRLSLYEGQQDCDRIRLSPQVPGVYDLEVNLAQGLPQYEATLFNIVPGPYTGVAWAFQELQVFGFGCTETPVTVESGQQSELTITLQPF